MGLMDKLKGILFDEEIEEIPEIKNEPVKETKKEENTIKEIKIPKEEKEEEKTESTFTFPIDFEDDFEEPVRVKKEREEVKKPLRKETPARDFSNFLNKRDERKQFKPTPIISPVYGILDQNYKKEDVIVKKDVLRKPNELSLEEVRKRAFGSLEDDIEQNLTCEVIKDEEQPIEIKNEIIEDKQVEKVIIEEKEDEIIVEAPVDKMKTIGELMDEDSLSINIPELESINDEEDEYTNSDTTEIEINIPKNSIDDLFDKEQFEEEVDEELEEIDEEENKEDDIDDDEADLFSLIDSMYEEKGE